MSKNIFTDVRIFAGGADLTGASNKCELKAEVEDKDVTTFESAGWGEHLGGLKTGSFDGEGFWEAGDDGRVDDSTWAGLGATVPLTVGPTAATVGSLAYVMKTLRTNYTILGQVGDVAPWKAEGTSNWPISRGQFAHPPGTARTSDGSGTAVELVAVPAGSRLYAALHVLSGTGTDPTLTVTVESYEDNTFADPTTQLTFTEANGISSEILRTNGDAITDTFYRVSWTIGGTAPSFTFVAALGIA